MRIRAAFLAAIAGFVVLGACSSPTEPAEPLVITRISQPGFSGYRTPRRLVIRTPPEWQAAWAVLFEPSQFVPTLPPVDFSRDVVLLAAAGVKPTSGYFISIESVVATRDTATVTVHSYAPGTGCELLTVETQPVEAVSVAFRERFEFVELFDVRNCSSERLP